jgi:hypothetical protein
MLTEDVGRYIHCNCLRRAMDPVQGLSQTQESRKRKGVWEDLQLKFVTQEAAREAMRLEKKDGGDVVALEAFKVLHTTIYVTHGHAHF